MKIKETKITVRDLSADYEDNGEGGVVGYHGNLDIRPPYQREFIYKGKDRDAVINTVNNRFPLNAMYWADNGNGKYEVMDGQQRTISICQYVNGDFSIKDRFFHNLEKDEKEEILNYTLHVYVCEGGDKEKLDWFKIINIAGKPLTDQEMRNAVYHGSWVAAAKIWFSKTGCPAAGLGAGYLSGEVNRQEYLETAIKWINNGNVEGYMKEHQHDPDAAELWGHFQKVIDWVESVFPKSIRIKKGMRGVNWGKLHSTHKGTKFDSQKVERDVAKLIQREDELINLKGIYPFVLDGDERHLNIRAFTPKQKSAAYLRQGKKCAICGEQSELEDMDADHIKPWSKGNKTDSKNCQVLCRSCNIKKGAK
ncbi:MAG: DUF262 domain-containing protein [Betaproteobacteria bacterium]|nr:DUF262 domain-containing protein [Betaproteobacteria bacterium]